MLSISPAAMRKDFCEVLKKSRSIHAYSVFSLGPKGLVFPSCPNGCWKDRRPGGALADVAGGGPKKVFIHHTMQTELLTGNVHHLREDGVNER